LSVWKLVGVTLTIHTEGQLVNRFVTGASLW